MTATMSIARAAITMALLGGMASWWPVHLSTHAGQQANPPSRPAGNADAGRQAFVKKGCYACHGREGQGSPTTGPRLGPNPTPLATFTRYVRAPRGQMPPYTEKVVSDSELVDMYAFLLARPRPVSIDALVPK